MTLLRRSDSWCSQKFFHYSELAFEQNMLLNIIRFTGVISET